ncbi:MAG: ABC transporter transmembrane domain-containing protein [Candidatus Accumulibacter sp.]|uniref:ABC transporter transmembrane domain-containing protein n=1 Tax=Accumulibacter sp. TaxID=2053492 RepID=UPI0025DD5EF2|nr:ABC transporter transmembrane domain-containing protein [Accumulibacter sp.]MCM8595215.1 ABC transporter transmembrane domain-containing protein [Accumulibacter sp.]MCM8625171.1 ABC transporter transmembrane domain-containing protein [Accumulibacter sp.]MDS4049361.1 ABC transporter transmembrane domain-containing protein [Accumulibacter sp.]
MSGLLPYVRPYRAQVFLALLLLLIAAATTLALPYAVKGLVDGGLVVARAGSDPGRSLVGRHFLLLFAGAAVLGLATAGRFYMMSWIGERVTADLRLAVYGHVLRQSPQFFETLRTGEVLSRLTADTTVIHHAVGSSLSMGMRNLVLFVGGLTMLLSSTPRLVLTVTGIVVLFVFPAVVIGRRVRRLSRAAQDRLADTSGLAGEMLHAIPVVQSYTREVEETARFAEANEQAFRTSMHRARTRSALTAFVIVGVFGSLLYGLYGGVQAVFAGEISAGELSQTALYVIVIAGSVGVLAEVWSDLLRASGASERLLELLAARSPVADPEQPVSLPGVSGGLRVSFADVSFAYPSRPAQPVLHGLCLTIAAGQTVALVGPSGAGKTTVFQLLQRFYDVDGGSLAIDGQDLRRLRLSDLRSHVAVVPQEAVIFSGSISDNIRYGRPAADEDEVRKAAQAAFVDEFAGQLPDRLRTFVGERGLRLSGGQRQRVAIARAILKDAPLLLLDEATSSLDAESERIVQQALDAAMAGRTTIVIAHRLATVQRADRIFVLDQGRVVEAGRHEELIKLGGLYARLAALQFVA